MAFDRKEYERAYYEKNKAIISAKAKAKYQQNKEAILARQRERDRASRANNPPRPLRKSGALRQKEYRERHPEKCKKAREEWRRVNIKQVRKWRRAHHHKGMKDPVFVVVKRLRTRLNDEVRFRGRKTTKITSAMALIGCTRAELATHIERQFKPGMAWDNREEWHIDHIRPVSSFNMMDIEEQKKCFHFSNLRPLWKSENCSKGAKIIQFQKAS